MTPTYCIKRTYNKFGDADYLIGLDKKWLVVWGGCKAVIMKFTKPEAEAMLAKLDPSYHTMFPNNAKDVLTVQPLA